MKASVLKTSAASSVQRVLIIDVREMDEIAAKPFRTVPNMEYVSLPLSVMRMLPSRELAERIRSALPDANSRIVLMCQSGGRSCVAQELLAAQGISAESLDGGCTAWQSV